MSRERAERTDLGYALRVVSSLRLDTPAILEIRAHLLGLSRASIGPEYGGRRVLPGSPEESVVLARFRPFAELLLLVAAADGTTDAGERALLLGAFRAMTGGRVSGSALLELERTLRAKIDAGDPEELLEDICTALAQDKRDAELGLTLASAVALADFEVDPAEVRLIQTLASWLSIPPSRVQELLDGSGEKRTV